MLQHPMVAPCSRPRRSLALDTLARLSTDNERAPLLRAGADSRMQQASHFVGERDRVDARLT